MHRFPALILGLGVASLLLVGTGLTDAFAEDGRYDGIPVKQKQVQAPPAQGSGFSTSQADTIWVGYTGVRTAANPYGVGMGGVWDFDLDAASTDSTQFWSFYLIKWTTDSGTLPTPAERPVWYWNNGNDVNIGDTNLWLDRESRGLVAQNKGPAQTAGYLRTGITGMWHVDNMASVSTPVAGANSAWCGLRGPNDFSYLDTVTGNPINGDLARYWWFGGADIRTSFPGYDNQQDQILYRDVTLQAGVNTGSFRFRTDMSDEASTELNGSAWFNPEPTSLSNLITTPAPQGPIDSLMVWVGLPQEAAYDVNKRWLSEVINFNSAFQPKKLNDFYGKVPSSGPADTTATFSIDAADWGGAGTVVRLAFQVKTNLRAADGSFDNHGFDSVEGAALIDDVVLNAGIIGDFEGATDIMPRHSLPGGGVPGPDNDPTVRWITTGKPPPGYGHVENIIAGGLPYDDPCGDLGSPDRICDLVGNIIVLSNHDDPDHAHYRESWVAAESPTIDLYNGSPIQNALDAEGFDLMRMEYQIWSGFDDTDTGVFFNVGARYHGPTFQQKADEIVPAWSNNLVPPYIANWPILICAIDGPGADLDGVIPPPSQLDSMKVFVWIQTRCARFGATVNCGQNDGLYWDNIRVGFTGGGGSAVSAQFWDLLSDTFPFNENIAEGSVAFDTTTALIKSGLNQGNAQGGEGVIIGDSLSIASPFVSATGAQTRLDMVFRILPGPGNYSVKGDKSSALWKVPSNPGLGTATAGDGSFFGEYLQANGLPYGKGNHNAGWDATTWNSARMDSADNLNLSPIITRDLGNPVDDAWEGTYHESDPIGGLGAPLAITKNLCFLVDPVGTVDELNICCSAAACAATPFFESWPPSAYGSVPTTTQEHTKIIPDGIFTPGTHIEYFMRRTDADGVTDIALLPDTLVVIQPALGPFSDGQRFLEVGVFPDMWKDTRFGGQGLACMIVFDGSDRRGMERPLIGALDSLGYGKNNGAGRGWWEDEWSTSNPDIDDPSNWVFPNQGQKGLAFDWYDIQASEAGEGARPGCRLNDSPPQLLDRQCKQGPTPDMLKFYYDTIIFSTGDLDLGAMHDGVDFQEQSDDVALFTDFLATSTTSDVSRRVFMMGDGLAFDLGGSGGTLASATLLNSFFGTTFVADDYRAISNNLTTPSSVQNMITEFNTPRWIGWNNSCTRFADVLLENAPVGGELAQRYEDSGDGDGSITPGSFGSAVYREADNVSRFYTTLIAGYQFGSLLGIGIENTFDDAGRQSFISDALVAFNLCASAGPVIAIGDQPGAQGAQLNFVRGAFPNPSVSGLAKVSFSLAQPAKVTFRFYNVAGRLVHEELVDYASGGPKVYNWNGQTSTGMRTSPGVYFYRLSAPGIQFQNNSQRMVLLGGN